MVQFREITLYMWCRHSAAIFGLYICVLAYLWEREILLLLFQIALFQNAAAGDEGAFRTWFEIRREWSILVDNLYSEWTQLTKFNNEMTPK